MSKKLTLRDETHNILKKAAEMRDISMSEYLDQLLHQVGVTDKDTKVVLSIPPSLAKKNKVGLQGWLHVRSDAILNAMYPEV